MAIYFTLEEMKRSYTANKYGIRNEPEDPLIEENLKKTMYILDLARVYIGNPIIINSGYRTPKLNEMIGGVSESMHTKGLAADFRTVEKRDINRMYDFLNKNKNKFKIKELINYGNFIHMAISNSLTI